MPLIVSGISLPFEQPEENAVKKAAVKLGGHSYSKAWIARRAVDARKKNEICFVYSVGFDIDGDDAAVAEKIGRGDVTVRNDAPLEITRGQKQLSQRPVVVGFGPAGMFAALLLARQGLRPVVLERGGDVDTRVAQVEGFWSTGALNTNSNVQFGEGGAGTFSDGKLTTRIGDSRCRFVLEQLVAHGAPEDILVQAKPHVGTDKLRAVVKSIREEIIRLGGELHFDTCMTGIGVKNGRVASVQTDKGEFAAEVMILAPGHSARDVFYMLRDMNLPMQSKAFSVGVRIEHLQEDIDSAQYGRCAGHELLPKGEYQLSYRQGERGVYTFCMCPGGVVVPAASEQGMVVTNGMSRHARDGVNGNSALVVSVDSASFGKDLLDGVEFQRRLETTAYLAGGSTYAAPAQTVDRFLAGKGGMKLGRVQPTYSRGITDGVFDDILPHDVTDMMRKGIGQFSRRMKGFDAPDALMTGIECRTSSPVRILRGEDLQSTGLEGLYPCGEGAGYAGGIVSAAVDGVRIAQEISANYRSE